VISNVEEFGADSVVLDSPASAREGGRTDAGKGFRFMERSLAPVN
jgi:hypothetical protein